MHPGKAVFRRQDEGLGQIVAGDDLKKPALNSDLWEILLTLTQKHDVHYHWVKGHAENPKNNRCDELAVSEWKKRK